MEKTQKTTFITIFFLCILYFCLMVFPNSTGAKTPEMLSVFEVDEYAQYEHVIRMLTPGETLYQSVRNFLIYLHYYYGYPFFFWSALLLIPLKLFSGNIWASNTMAIVCWLRQSISVLPMIISIVLLVWIVTKFRKPAVSILSVLFLLTIPAVISNNFWWHPDSLTFLFITLTFFFLDLDQLRAGKYFFFAAASCGAAIGTKYLGLYFAATIPLYLFLAFHYKRISLKKAIVSAILFLLTMGAFVIISNPLLLLPQERAEIIRTQKQQMELSGEGIFIKYQNDFFSERNIPEVIRQNFAPTWFFILSLAAVFFGVFQKDLRLRCHSWIILSYSFTAILATANTPASRLHYYLPVFLPLFSLVSIFFTGKRFSNPFQKKSLALLFVIVPLFLLLWIPNLKQSCAIYQTTLHREKQSPSIQLYADFLNDIAPHVSSSEDRMIRVYRDWKIYFPQTDGYTVLMDWNMADEPLINAWKPDFIMLEKENITLFAAQDFPNKSVNVEKMQLVHEFYEKAAKNEIPGFSLVKENGFGVIFCENSICR